MATLRITGPAGRCDTFLLKVTKNRAERGSNMPHVGVARINIPNNRVTNVAERVSCEAVHTLNTDRDTGRSRSPT